ncbi:hypothetical protein B566_EDAN011528 [Ephemera danica]|nr:hypothetical protein B566_EDAN011528 [Ephemera danica]
MGLLPLFLPTLKASEMPLEPRLTFNWLHMSRTTASGLLLPLQGTSERPQFVVLQLSVHVDGAYAELSHVTYPALGKTIFTIFMILVPILLLNMLIAMMGNTYAQVIERSEKEWMKQRVGKVTIAELRKRGMTGEELNLVMWGRADISTPVRHPPAMSPEPGEPLLPTDALTAALDQMAFAADLPIPGTGTKEPGPGAPAREICMLQSKKVTEPHSPDPLRDLVMLDSAPDLTPERAAVLAAQAALAAAAPDALNPHVTVAAVVPPAPSGLSVSAAMAATFAFLPSKPATPPGPLLGRASRLRRVRSAARERFMSARSSRPQRATQQQGGRRPSVQSWDSFGSADNVTLWSSKAPPAEGPLLGRASRLRRVRSAARERFMSARSSRPQRATQQQGGRRPSVQSWDSFGSADNVTLWSSKAPPAGAVSPGFCSSSPDETCSKDVASTSRPKTASNKVGPTTGAREVQSAGGAAAMSRQQLNSWSTRDIASMNTLLAWDQPPGEQQE